MDQLIDELIDLVTEDAECLGCADELHALRARMADGSSAYRQRKVFTSAMDKGEDRDMALEYVVAHLIKEYHVEL